jgi:hypothetical protein
MAAAAHMSSADVTVADSRAIEQHSGELDHPGMRRRVGQSPPPPGRHPSSAAAEHTVVSVNPEPPSPPRMLFRQAPTSAIPGDVERSVLVKRMPPAYDKGPASALEATDEYCVVNKIVLWNAYSVYTSIRAVDTGLIRAIDNGEVDLAVQVPAARRGDGDVDDVTAGQVADVARRRINQWRVGYADRLMTYSTAVDVFVAKSTGSLVQATERGDADAEILLGLIHALNQYKAMTIPDPRHAESEGGP